MSHHVDFQYPVELDFKYSVKNHQGSVESRSQRRTRLTLTVLLLFQESSESANTTIEDEDVKGTVDVQHQKGSGISKGQNFSESLRLDLA